MKNKTITYYNNNAQNLCASYNSIDFDFIQNQIIDFFDKGISILELGSGSGRDASFLLEKGYNVIGIDGSTEMIKESIILYPKLKNRLYHAELANEFPIIDIKFEALLSIATLIHFNVDELNRILSNAWEVLQNNSPAFITVSLNRKQIEGNSRFFLKLSREEWSNLFEQNGFKVIKVKENKDVLERGIIWYSFYLRKV